MSPLSDADVGIGSSPGLSDADVGIGQAPSMSAGDVASGAVKNLVPSAMKFGHDIVQPFIHPIETAQNIGNLGQGVLEKTGLMSGNEHEKYADAVGKFFSDRYGGVENLKKTLSEDPVGFAADLSTVLTGGGSLAARAPGIIGKVGEVAGTIGRATDPLNAVAAAAKGVGFAGTEALGKLGTHTGGESLRLGAEAGYEGKLPFIGGGQEAKAYQEHIRDVAPMAEPVEDARRAIVNMRNQRGAAYKSEMASVRQNPKILSWNDVDRAFIDAFDMTRYKGAVKRPEADKIRQEMENTVANWQSLPASQYHTPEGFDALKQSLGEKLEGLEKGSPAHKVANEIYNSVRDTIVREDPKYAKIMKAYEEASHEIREIEKTLSLPPDKRSGATIDTSLRKLQSVLRDNVNTSFGRRKELAQFLVDNGAPDLMYKLAGQANKSWTPRGLGALAMEIGGIMLGKAGKYGAAAVLGGVSSPRMAGEAAYYAGRLASPLRYIPTEARASIARTAYQVGRQATPLRITVTKSTRE